MRKNLGRRVSGIFEMNEKNIRADEAILSFSEQGFRDIQIFKRNFFLFLMTAALLTLVAAVFLKGTAEDRLLFFIAFPFLFFPVLVVFFLILKRTPQTKTINLFEDGIEFILEPKTPFLKVYISANPCFVPFEKVSSIKKTEGDLRIKCRFPSSFHMECLIIRFPDIEFDSPQNHADMILHTYEAFKQGKSTQADLETT